MRRYFVKEQGGLNLIVNGGPKGEFVAGEHALMQPLKT
jgi:hypothetical protein